MSTVRHQVSGPVLSFIVDDEIRRVRDELRTASARIARTLVKDGPIRVTLVGLKPGGGLHEHVAKGPVTIHVLDGAIELEAGGERRPASAGTLLAVDAMVPHAVTSREGAILLVTVSQPLGAEAPA